MKLIWIISAVLIVVACADYTKTKQNNVKNNHDQPKPAYDDNWYLSQNWPGEYPNGFTILKEGIVLSGRAEMNKTSPKALPCPVPKLANYNPWNHRRIITDKLGFVAAARTLALPVIQDNVVSVLLDGKALSLSLEAGETLTYLTYIGEGFALVRYQGMEYQINEADLELSLIHI